MAKRSFKRAFGFKDSGAGRRYIKRRRRFFRSGFKSKRFFRSVAKIARKAVGSEGKIYNNVGSNTFTNYQTRYNNIMWDLANGTGQGNIIGEQVFVKGFRLNFEFKQVMSGSTSTINPVTVRIMVIKWRDYKAGSLVNQWVDDTANQAQYYRNTGDLFTSPPNTDQIGRVMKDFTFNIVPQITSQTRSFFKKVWVPINKNFRYESGSLGEGRDFNYYVVCLAAQVNGTAILDNAVNVTLEKTIYYRDA